MLFEETGFTQGNGGLPGANSSITIENEDIIYIHDFISTKSDNPEVVVIYLSFDVSSPVTATFYMEDSQNNTIINGVGSA